MRLDSRLVAAGIMAAVFVSGAVTGAVVGPTVLDDRTSFDGRPSPTRWDGDRREDGRRGDRDGPDRRRPREPRGLISSRAVEHLSERLELDGVQRDSLEAILERQRGAAAAVFEDIGPRLRTVLDSTNIQIRALLDPDQQAEFDAIIQEDRDVLGRRFVPPDSARRP